MLAELVHRKEVNPSRIYATSLTRATKWAFLKKAYEKGVAVPEENIRTLHSFCYQLLKAKRGVAPTILKLTDIKEFFESKGFEFVVNEEEANEDLESEYTASEYRDEIGNRLYQAFNKLRLTYDGSISMRGHAEQFYERERENMPVSLKTFIALAREYFNWLRENNVYDFTRLLTEAFYEGVELSGDLLILDEFQDIGNLHFLLIQYWLKNFKHVIIAGDDDQAIYEFAGASPRHIIELEADQTFILPQSYRLPQKIFELAYSIIRKNRYRVPKNFKPRAEKGEIRMFFSQEDAIESLNGRKTLVLARNKVFVDEWKKLFELYNIPYKPIGLKRQLPAILKILWIYQRLIKSKPVSGEDIMAFTIALKPLIRNQTGRKQIRETLIKELFEKIKNKNFGGEMGKIAYMVYTKPIHILFPDEDANVLEKWLRRAENYEAWLSPNLEVGTIHSAKGLEADVVYLDTRVTRRVANTFFYDPEAERRVLYVGVTRAKEKLCLVSAKGKASYEGLGLL